MYITPYFDIAIYILAFIYLLDQILKKRKLKTLKFLEGKENPNKL